MNVRMDKGEATSLYDRHHSHDGQFTEQDPGYTMMRRIEKHGQPNTFAMHLRAGPKIELDNGNSSNDPIFAYRPFIGGTPTGNGDIGQRLDIVPTLYKGTSVKFGDLEIQYRTPNGDYTSKQVTELLDDLSQQGINMKVIKGVRIFHNQAYLFGKEEMHLLAATNPKKYNDVAPLLPGVYRVLGLREQDPIRGNSPEIERQYGDPLADTDLRDLNIDLNELPLAAIGQQVMESVQGDVELVDEDIFTPEELREMKAERKIERKRKLEQRVA